MGEESLLPLLPFCLPMEKSFVIANLAYSMANSGQRVVLREISILRRPRVEKILKAEKITKGAVDVIMGNTTIDEVIQHYAVNMDFIAVELFLPIQQ